MRAIFSPTLVLRYFAVVASLLNSPSLLEILMAQLATEEGYGVFGFPSLLITPSSPLTLHHGRTRRCCGFQWQWICAPY